MFASVLVRLPLVFIGLTCCSSFIIALDVLLFQCVQLNYQCRPSIRKWVQRGLFLVQRFYTSVKRRSSG